MVPEQESGERLAVINGLRGFAILAVVFHHLFSREIELGSFPVTVFGISVPLSAPFSNGWQGVDLFFLLSGFVLFLPYCRGERAFRSREDWLGFYKRRFLRLMPLYYLTLLVGVIFVYHPGPRTLEFWTDMVLLGSATFTFTERLFFPPYNFVLWSLGVEIWFSILFPALVVAERRMGIVSLSVIALAVSLATRLAALEVYPDFRLPYLNPLKDSILGRLDQFVMGMALCAVFVKRPRLSPSAAGAAVAAGLVAIFATCVGWDWVILGTLPPVARALLPALFTVALFTAIRGLLALPVGSLTRRLVANGPLQVLGMMCYSIYLWHTMVLKKWPTGFIVGMLAYVALTLTLSALTYRYVEFGHRRDWRSLFRGAD